MSSVVLDLSLSLRGWPSADTMSGRCAATHNRRIESWRTRLIPNSARAAVPARRSARSRPSPKEKTPTRSIPIFAPIAKPASANARSTRFRQPKTFPMSQFAHGLAEAGPCRVPGPGLRHAEEAQTSAPRATMWMSRALHQTDCTLDTWRSRCRPRPMFPHVAAGLAQAPVTLRVHDASGRDVYFAQSRQWSLQAGRPHLREALPTIGTRSRGGPPESSMQHGYCQSVSATSVQCLRGALPGQTRSRIAYVPGTRATSSNTPDGTRRQADEK
jgi:hypothetical protein